MHKTSLILVGGFLGAGKTTLLKQAATRLMQRGGRVALLANDQAADLVDTAVLRETGAAVDEVSGGCFCCRFPDMIAAMDRLQRHTQVDYIVAEPVGSCTDLSATVLQPLKQMYGEQFVVAPYSVLIDVTQIGVLLRCGHEPASVCAGFPEDVLYICRKQVEEADVIVLNKVDLVAAREAERARAVLAKEFPDTPLVTTSARSGEGVDTWLELLFEDRPAGRTVAEVDYDIYAAGEAALGWMNASAKLRAGAPVDWQGFARQLLEGVQHRVRQADGQIAHLKLYLTTHGPGYVAGNVVSNDGPVSLRGGIAQDVQQASLLLNARVRIHADQLRAITEECLHATTAEYQMGATISGMRCFFPSRPVPTHRFPAPVQPPSHTCRESTS